MFTKLISNVTHVSVNKQLVIIPDWWGIVTGFCQGIGYKSFSHSKRLHGLHYVAGNILPASHGLYTNVIDVTKLRCRQMPNLDKVILQRDAASSLWGRNFRS